MENVEYREWVPMGVIVKGLVAMIILIVVIVSFAVLLFNGKILPEDFFGIAFSWAILTFILFVFWNYRGLRIEISGEKLTVVYGLFNKQSFLLKEIISCQTTRSLGRCLGIGVRYGIDGSFAYTTSFGPAVEVVPKAGRTFVFSSNNPDKICGIIRNGIPPDS